MSFSELVDCIDKYRRCIHKVGRMARDRACIRSSSEADDMLVALHRTLEDILFDMRKILIESYDQNISF